MRTLYTAAISALLCSLVWIGGTAKLNDEYIKVIDQKDSRIAQLERKTGQDRNTYTHVIDKKVIRFSQLERTT